MASSNNTSSEPSRNGTPNSIHNSRFTSQAATAEDLLKDHTVGLVHLSDFRKRRAEALEQKEREASERKYSKLGPGKRSGAATPSDGSSTPQPQAKKKKKKKNPTKGKLSFDVGEEEGEETLAKKSNPSVLKAYKTDGEACTTSSEDQETVKRRLGPNASVSIAPKIMTKSALLKEAQAREQLRKEFLLIQEKVKATDFLIPFVFYDGTNTPGGRCKVKKGDHIWLFLDRSRKVGAELSVGVSGEKSSNNRGREWARVGVDDLMLVRGEIIIPHHYEFYYFIINKTLGPSGKPLFPYSTQPTPNSTLDSSDSTKYDPLTGPSSKTANSQAAGQDVDLEGADEDPTFTKVVDRRWYERNKHIFPASVWEEFDPTKDYSKGIRRDAEGNSFFF